MTLGEPVDRTDDATISWPESRRRLDVGTLAVRRTDAESAGNCRDINFDPLVLTSGIVRSDDPLLSARSAAYSLPSPGLPAKPRRRAPSRSTDCCHEAEGQLVLRSAKVDLPFGDRTFPDRPGADAVNNNCLSCHSAGMVLNQPALPKAQMAGPGREDAQRLQGANRLQGRRREVDYLGTIKGAQ